MRKTQRRLCLTAFQINRLANRKLSRFIPPDFWMKGRPCAGLMAYTCPLLVFQGRRGILNPRSTNAFVTLADTNDGHLIGQVS